MGNTIEDSFAQFLKAQELEKRESRAPYNSPLDRIFDIKTVWEFMRELSVNPNFRKSWHTASGFFDGLKDNSTIQQEALFRLISAFVQEPNVDAILESGKGQFWYLFANAVASYSNYNNYYWVSKGGWEILINNGIDDSIPVTRNKIFQIRHERKKLLVFEHLCPATQLISLMLSAKEKINRDNNKWSSNSISDAINSMIRTHLHNYGLVAIITKEEDLQLTGDLRDKIDTKLNSPLEQMMSRYNAVGIDLEKKLIPVYGKMYR